MKEIKDVSKLTYTHVQGGQFRWITVSTIMLALGTILHAVSPSVAGVTPNWTIATYCVAINLTRPTLRQSLGIGLVAALINVFTSKSALPYGNLISEPLGAFTCAVLVHYISNLKIGKLNLMPILSAFISTVASGGAFITCLYLVLGLPSNVYWNAMWPLVLMVSLCNAVVAPFLYIPAQKLLARQTVKGQELTDSSDHSDLHIVPSVKAPIVIDHMSYRYGNQSEYAVKDINLVVNEGDFLVITGPAGCGKSTICMAMAGAVPKFYGGTMEGMVFINGKAVTQLEIPDVADDIGIVLADYDTQLVTMTVAEEVAFALENRGYTAEAIQERIAIVLEQVGLTGLEDRNVYSLSGGQRQRLAIASVLAVNPSILVLDEPTSSLDPEGTEELYRLVGSLNRDHGITVVVIDHDLHAVLPYASRMVLIDGGELKIDSSVEDVLSYMYDTNTYVDALPSLFVTYKSLAAKGIDLDTPWLSLTSAQSSLMKGER